MCWLRNEPDAPGPGFSFESKRSNFKGMGEFCGTKPMCLECGFADASLRSSVRATFVLRNEPKPGLEPNIQFSKIVKAALARDRQRDGSRGRAAVTLHWACK